MELFREDGHLTDAGLQALAAEQLDELGRLEAAEHLSFCDECLVRYTALLADDALLAPPQPQTLPVLRRVRSHLAQRFASRYLTYAAAAVLALVLWGVGAFTSLTTPPQRAQTQQTQQAAPTEYLTSAQRADNFFKGVGSYIAQSFNSLVGAQGAGQNAPAPHADAAQHADSAPQTPSDSHTN